MIFVCISSNVGASIFYPYTSKKEKKYILKYYYASYIYMHMYHVIFAGSTGNPNLLYPLDLRMQYFLEYLLICLFTIPGKACIVFSLNSFKMYISRMSVNNECYRIYLLFEIHEYQFKYGILQLNKDILNISFQHFVNFDKEIMKLFLDENICFYI